MMITFARAHTRETRAAQSRLEQSQDAERNLRHTVEILEKEVYKGSSALGSKLDNLQKCVYVCA